MTATVFGLAACMVVMAFCLFLLVGRLLWLTERVEQIERAQKNQARFVYRGRGTP